MKKILLTLLLLIQFLKAESMELNLTDFSIFASQENGVNIFLCWFICNRFIFNSKRLLNDYTN